MYILFFQITFIPYKERQLRLKIMEN